MLHKIIHFSLLTRLLVIVATVLLIVFGIVDNLFPIINWDNAAERLNTALKLTL